MEKKYFYLLEWSDIVVDIRGQFPLFDGELAINIAQEKGIEYPAFKGTDIPFIITTDFVITISSDNGKLKNIARTVKPSEDLDKKSVIELCYWEEKGINWGVVNERDRNHIIARQLPKYQINMSYINAKLNNNPMFEANVLSTVASAYEKGIVDYSSHLITQHSVCGKLQKTDVKA